MATNLHTNSVKKRRQLAGDKWQLADFDTLQREKKSEGGSVWKGKRGLYIIRHLDKHGEHLPIAKVILNNEFLTGLFRTKNNAIFSGDMELEGKKRFLLFKMVASEKMEVTISV